jgi:hypothetical protein
MCSSLGVGEFNDRQIGDRVVVRARLMAYDVAIGGSAACVHGQPASEEVRGQHEEGETDECEDGLHSDA